MASTKDEPWAKIFSNIVDDIHEDLDKEPWIKIYRQTYNHVLLHHQGDKYSRHVLEETLIADAKAIYPFMRHKTYEDYVHYWGAMARKSTKARLDSIPYYSSDQLWRMLYESPLTCDEETNKLAEALNHSYFDKVIEIGKLDGITPFRLVPGAGVMEIDTELFGDLDDWADDMASAVKYAEGHPSEGELRLVPNEVLRRFWDIGWIYMAQNGGFVKTGHVLAMDVEPGRERNLWLILAKEWQSDEDEPRTIRPPTQVPRNDISALGLFPGQRNRTPIAKLVPMNTVAGQSGPILRQLGPNFEFRLLRYGSEDSNDECMAFGPSLAHCMKWFKKTNGEEVCFDENHEEYMRYDKGTGHYHYLNLKEEST